MVRHLCVRPMQIYVTHRQHTVSLSHSLSQTFSTPLTAALFTHGFLLNNGVGLCEISRGFILMSGSAAPRERALDSATLVTKRHSADLTSRMRSMTPWWTIAQGHENWAKQKWHELYISSWAFINMTSSRAIRMIYDTASLQRPLKTQHLNKTWELVVLTIQI